MKRKRIAAAVILSMLLCGCANSAQESQTPVSTPSTASVVSEAESSAEEAPSVVESVVSEAESSAEESPTAESTVSEAESSAEETPSDVESTVSEAEIDAEESSTTESTVSEAESSTEESKSKPRGNYTFEDGVLTVYSDQFFEKAYKMFAEYSHDSFELKNIVIEDGVTKIGNSAFNHCTNLEQINVSFFNVEIVSLLLSMILFCSLVSTKPEFSILHLT